MIVINGRSYLKCISGILYHLGFGNSLWYHDSVRNGNRSLCDNRFGFNGFLIKYSTRNFDNFGGFVKDGTRYFVGFLV